MELTIQVNPVERTVRLREVRALAAGDSCSVVLEGVRGADVSALRLALYRDAASDSPVASCPSFSPVRGHPNLATGDLRLDTTEMAAWFEAVRPEPEGSATDRDGYRSGDAAERAVRTDGWLVVSTPTRTWAACRVPVILRPGAGVSGVVDPTSIQSLVEGLVSASMSEALETKADLVDGKVPIEQLPSFWVSVLEYDAVSAFPTVGESGKIYVAKDTNKTYRWDVTQYVEISKSLALGETAETAYPGDKGKAATDLAALTSRRLDGYQAQYDSHLQNTSNPHSVTAEQVNAYTKTDVDAKLAKKADKATTLAGYGITDAATKSELDSVNQNAANAIFGVQSELSTKADLVGGKVPAAQLPAFVDDVLEYDAVSAFPATGEDGKIYVAKDTNLTYRWGGTDYVEISPSLALGETATTAYPGDKGKAASEKADAAYSAAESLANGVNSLAGTIGTHIRDTNNPHAVTAAQVGALPLTGGTVIGNLTLDVLGSGRSPKLEIFGVSSSGITLNAEYGGKITVGEGSNGGGQIVLKDSSVTGDVEAEVTIGTVKVRATLAAKADKATTLAGYGITDAATKTELNAKADKSALAAKADKSTTLAGYGITDGATKTELAELTAKVEYPLYAVPSTGLLKDRALNTTSLASVTVPENFTDLLIRASVASSLSVTMPEAITTKYGDTFPGEAGEYLITITKTGAAEAYVRTIKLEEVA